MIQESRRRIDLPHVQFCIQSLTHLIYGCFFTSLMASRGLRTRDKPQMQSYQRKVIRIFELKLYSMLWSDEENGLTLFLVSISFLDRSLYTITAVPFTEVRSIRRHTPALGWQYVIVVLSSGKQRLRLLRSLRFILNEILDSLYQL